LKSIVAIALALCVASAALAQGTAWQPLADIRPAQKLINIAGFHDDKIGITAGYSGSTFYTEDGGATWKQAEIASWCRFGLDILDGGTAFSCGNGGNNRVSSDGGKTWSAMQNHGPMEPANFRFLSFLDGKTGWAGGPSMLSATSDAGASWSDIETPADIDRVAAIALVPGGQAKTGFLIGSKGALFATADGGATWTEKPISAGGATLAYFRFSSHAPSAALRFTSPTEGIALAYMTAPKKGWVSLSTSDAGDNWKLEEITSELGPASSVYLSRDGRYATLFYSQRILVFKRTAN
jgi:photosystem II stability/assembly factor-like uncharacterized protein